MFFHDLIFFLFSYLVLWILQLIALPLIIKFSEKFKFIKDAAWGFGRFAVLLVLSFVTWQLAHIKIPVNNSEGIYLIFLISIFISLTYLKKIHLKNKKTITKFFKKYRKIIVIEEIVFLLSMIFLLVIRSFQPEILGLEKFMDAGFIQAYLKSSTLPAKDIWLANSNINYYSFGHFYNSVLVHLWSMNLAYAYNFLLATIFAFFTTQLFSLAFNLRANFPEKKKLFKKNEFNFRAAVSSGILAIFLIALGGNGHTIWYFFKNNGFEFYWYPDATRFIERTIHEFPAYSFVVCDLHAHVLSLPVTLLLALLIFIWLKELVNFSKKIKIKKIYKELFFQLSLVMGFLFGVLGMTNTWDMMVYGFFLIIIGIFLLLWKKKNFSPLLISALAVFSGALVTVLFWYLNFESIAQGLRTTTENTPFWQLLVLWGPHLFWAIIAVILFFIFYKRRISKDRTLIFYLGSSLILVLFLIVFPEFFYFKDIYTSHQRANTMFKLVFQAFMFLSMFLAVFFTVILPIGKSKRENKKLLLLYLPVSFFLFFSTLAYPFLAYRSYYGALKNYQGLNGLAWLGRKSPSSLDMINYLKQNEDQQVNILEAVGESYTEFARISAFSGMSTVLGWRVHEWLWRGGWDIPGQRTGEVKEIYTNPNSDLSQSYLKSYDVKYIVIGDKEREAYRLNLQSLLDLGEIVYQFNGNYLVKLY